MTRIKQCAKLFASSILLLTLSLLILIGKKPELLAHKIPIDFKKTLHSSIAVNEFGAIISSSNDPVAQGTIEYITLNVPKSRNSTQKIVRFGRLIRYPTAQATILICHGFMTDKHDVAFLRNMFPKGKFNFMTFDFRAHGENCEGQKCTLGRDEALDVITAAHFLKSHPHVSGKPIVVYAFSMGAVAAIEAQSQDNLFAAMILDCPFDSSENMIKRSLEKLQFTLFGYDFSIPARTLLEKYAFHPYVQSLIKGILKTISHFDTKNIDVRVYPINPAQSVQNITVPCFFIHCKNDEKISVDAVKNIYNNANASYKQLWLTNGRRHFDSYFYNPERYVKEIRSFIDKVVTNNLDHKSSPVTVEDDDEIFVEM